MADFLEEKRGEIAARLRELDPLVKEHARLLAAAAALDGLPAASAATGTSSSRATSVSRAGGRRLGRPRKQRTAVTTAAVAKASRGPGRQRGSGKRASQTVEIITAQPGITISELAQRMGIKSQYLYKVLPQLQNEGRVAKDGKGWKLAA